MKSLTPKIVWLLSMLMFIAPIGSAMSGSLMAQNGPQKISDIAKSHHMMSDSAINNLSLTHHHEQAKNQDVPQQDCQIECANCVYCSATNLSNSAFLTNIYKSSSQETPKFFSKSINISVDIRPPINS